MKSRIPFFLLLPLLLASCLTSSPPANFYVLTPLSQPRSVQVRDMLVGVGPVNLADYLDRNQLVSRASDVSLRLDEFHRWAGGLDRNVTQVLADNLSRLMSIDGVLAYPWSSAIDLDYQIVLDIGRFDYGPDDRVVLDVQWQLFDQRSRKLVDVRRGRFEVQSRDSSQAAMVQAQSEALARLSESLARVIESVAANE